MIPVVVAPPTSRQRRRPPSRWMARVVGAALVAAGVFGAVVWVAGFSPIGFERFDLTGGARTLRFDTVGEYIVYEERVEGVFPELDSLTVSGPDGELVTVRPPAGVTDGAVARSLPMFAAWEVGRFSVAEPGAYTIAALRPAAGAALPSSGVAIAPARTATWVGGWAGLVALALLPLAVGVGVLWASWGRPASEGGPRGGVA